LARAGIPYRDGTGRVFDFHALRCYYAVELLLSGVPLVAVQKLMRHSTPTLTANIYAQLGIGDLAAEVGKMRAA
jgi:site-specific recombinase XerC